MKLEKIRLILFCTGPSYSGTFFDLPLKILLKTDISHQQKRQNGCVNEKKLKSQYSQICIIFNNLFK